MNLILDASAVINLCNGRVFIDILSLSGFHWYVGPVVIDECGGSLRPGCVDARDELTDAISASKITLLSDENVPAALFGDLLEQHHLGPGETECILFAGIDNLGICTDDGKARKIIEALYGKKRLIGTIGLLSMAVRDGILVDRDADMAYALMLSCGAFLPKLPSGYFKSNLP